MEPNPPPPTHSIDRAELLGVIQMLKKPAQREKREPSPPPFHVTPDLLRDAIGSLRQQRQPQPPPRKRVRVRRRRRRTEAEKVLRKPLYCDVVMFPSPEEIRRKRLPLRPSALRPSPIQPLPQRPPRLHSPPPPLDLPQTDSTL